MELLGIYFHELTLICFVDFRVYWASILMIFFKEKNVVPLANFTNLLKLNYFLLRFPIITLS